MALVVGATFYPRLGNTGHMDEPRCKDCGLLLGVKYQQGRSCECDAQQTQSRAQAVARPKWLVTEGRVKKGPPTTNDTPAYIYT